MTTDRALKLLLTHELFLVIWLRAGFTRDQRSNYLRRFKKNALSSDKKGAILEKCGFSVKIEKQWKTPRI